MFGGGTSWEVLGMVLSQALDDARVLCLTSFLSWGERDAGKQSPLFCPINSCNPLPTATNSLSGGSCQPQVVCLAGKTVV